MKKVLIVEDRQSCQSGWAAQLAGKVEVIPAFTRLEAEEKFKANPDVDAIVMDACVPGHKPNTMVLVMEFRENFKGPMIAQSDEPPYREMLIKYGCNFECKKDDVPAKLCEILGLKVTAGGAT